MAWETRKKSFLKIGILIKGYIPDDMLLATMRLDRAGWRVSVSFQRDRPWDASRNIVATEALRDGSEWLFFWDSDVIIPSYAITRLVSKDMPIISGLYWRRHPEIYPELFRYNEKKILTPISRAEVLEKMKLPEPWDLLEVDGCGAGCLLVHRRVLEDMKKTVPLRSIDLPGGNLEYYEFFEYTIGKKQHGYSEDLELCDRLRQRGWPIFADLRVNCGHLTQMQVRDGQIDWSPLEVGRG